MNEYEVGKIIGYIILGIIFYVLMSKYIWKKKKKKIDYE